MSHITNRTQSSPLLRLSALAAVAIGTSMSSYAGGGEALDIELPSMRTPIEAVAPTASFTPSMSYPTASVQSPQMMADVYAEASPPSNAQKRFDPVLFNAADSAGTSTTQTLAALPADSKPLTREDVKDELKTARAMNTITPSNEIGDTPEVLMAREKFYVLQTESIKAEYAAAAQREMDARMAQQALEQEQRALQQQGGQSMEPQAADTPQVISQADAAVDVVVVAPNMTIAELVDVLDRNGAEGVVVVTEDQEAD